MQRLNNSPDGATSASYYKINYIRLYTYNNLEPMDITNMVNYVEIFESMYSPFLTINVNITDTLSLNHTLPIMGEEFIEVDIRGADNETGLINQAFYIYKMQDRMSVGDKAYTYTLCCISPSAVLDMNLKISQSVYGQPSELIASKFAKALNITKDIYSHPTKNSVSYISNYWTPMQNIKYLSDRAVSKSTGSASYFFFETKNKFYYVPLDELVKQQSVATLFDVPNTHTGDMQDEMSIIHKLQIDTTFSYIDQLMNGAYGNRSLTVDATKKSYQYSYYDFIESYQKFDRLNKLPFATENAPRRFNAIFRTMLSPSNTVPNMPQTSSNEWFMPRLTEVSVLGSQSIMFDAVGRFTINAGNVVDIVVPISMLPTKESNASTMKDTFDRTLSGRYLVTSIRHLLSRERHTISVRASKESMLAI